MTTRTRPAHGGYPGFVPLPYACGECGRVNCKLWRHYQTFLEHQELFCWRCAAATQNMEVSEPDDRGMVTWIRSPHGPDSGLKTDQIGWLVPAVPAGETFWGYTSVPDEGLAWWRALPA